jgi:hypothetical protein
MYLSCCTTYIVRYNLFHLISVGSVHACSCSYDRSFDNWGTSRIKWEHTWNDSTNRSGGVELFNKEKNEAGGVMKTRSDTGQFRWECHGVSINYDVTSAIL